MRITKITPYPVVRNKRPYLFVVVDTDDGISGIGEAGITGREATVAAAVNQLQPLIEGTDPFNTEHIWQLLFRGGFFPAQRIQTAAISAIDIALWDIKGKALQMPVYSLLGGRVREKVVCYPHNQSTTGNTSELVESCAASKEEGWKFVRWGVPSDGDILEPRKTVLKTLGQLYAVRETVGEQIDIIIDVHTRLDPADSMWLCREAETFQPFFMEDPVRAENPGSYRQLRSRTTVPLAAGEQYSSKWEFRPLIEEELIDYARIDLCIAGGLTEAKKIAGWCETHYIKLAVHNPLSPVSGAACLQLNLSCPNVGVQEQPKKPGTVFTDLFPVQPIWEDGYLFPNERPGLGIEFDRAALEKEEFTPADLPRLRREDGSFTNW